MNSFTSNCFFLPYNINLLFNHDNDPNTFYNAIPCDVGNITITGTINNKLSATLSFSGNVYDYNIFHDNDTDINNIDSNTNVIDSRDFLNSKVNIVTNKKWSTGFISGPSLFFPYSNKKIITINSDVNVQKYIQSKTDGEFFYSKDVAYYYNIFYKLFFVYPYTLVRIDNLNDKLSFNHIFIPPPPSKINLIKSTSSSNKRTCHSCPHSEPCSESESGSGSSSGSSSDSCSDSRSSSCSSCSSYSSSCSTSIASSKSSSLQNMLDSISFKILPPSDVTNDTKDDVNFSIKDAVKDAAKYDTKLYDDELNLEKLINVSSIKNIENNFKELFDTNNDDTIKTTDNDIPSVDDIDINNILDLDKDKNKNNKNPYSYENINDYEDIAAYDHITDFNKVFNHSSFNFSNNISFTLPAKFIPKKPVHTFVRCILLFAHKDYTYSTDFICYHQKVASLNIFTNGCVTIDFKLNNIAKLFLKYLHRNIYLRKIMIPHFIFSYPL